MASHISPSKMETKASSSTAQDFIDYGDVCRICGSDENSLNLIGIYSNEGLGDDLPTKINTYLPVTVASTDDLPLQCCTKCVSTLNSWHVFVNNSVEADSKWKNFHVLASSSNKLLNEEEGDDGIGDRDDDQSELDDDMPLSELVETKQEPEDDDEAPKESIAKLGDQISSLGDHFLVKNQPSRVKKEHVSSSEDEPPRKRNPKTKTKFRRILKIVDSDADSKSDADMRSKVDKSTFTCLVCGKSYAKWRLLKAHERNKHVEGQYPCVVCGKISRTKRLFHSHQKVHTPRIKRPRKQREPRVPLPEFECKLCNKRLVSARNLMEHMKVHNDDKPYQCDQCGETFKIQSQLRKHYGLRHDESQRYFCCGKTFGGNHNYKRHMQEVHTDQRVFCCTVCGKAFKTNRAVLRHEKIHSATDKQHECTICHKTYALHQYLRNHLLMVHKIYAKDQSASTSQTVQIPETF